MTGTNGVSRRSIIAWGGILGTSAAFVALAPRATAGPGNFKNSDKELSSDLSPNGWSIQNSVDAGGAVWTAPIQGTDFSVAMRLGAATTLFSHLIRRYHYEINGLRAGDVWGYNSVPGSSRPPELNHQSGTAIDIRPGWYPPGTQGGYTSHQQAALESILADFEGTVSWGGHSTPADESHFELCVGPKDKNLIKVVKKIEGWNSSMGQGPGTASSSSNSHRG